MVCNKFPHSRMLPQTIAILGGGITGLSSAFYLSRKFPSAVIFLLERQNRLGGWIQSQRVQLPNNLGSVLLEGGPRTLRPNGKSVLELIHLLHLEDRIVKVSKTAPAATARYLYIPKSLGGNATGLQLIPSISLRSSPLLFEILSSVIREPFRKYNRPANISDESVNSFLIRRFGDTMANKFGSALIHGIYAADSTKVSLKAALPSLWFAEESGRGSVIQGFLSSLFQGKESDRSYELDSTQDLMRGVAVYSFKDGMETLTSSLENYLRNLPNITILKNTEVQTIEPLKNQNIKISHSSGKPIDATHVISTVPLPVLGNLLGEAGPFSIPHLRHNPSSSVYVLNLVFPCPPAEIHPEGFGYLIPRPRTGYPSAYNPSSPGILGVVFDSCSLYEQDSAVHQDSYHRARHTKVTVMMGGPYPLPAPPSMLVSFNDENTVPLVRTVLDALKIHLSRDLPDPVYWRFWNNEACIPTLLPGHLDRMEELRAFLRDSPEWVNKFAVIGAGVGGVSITDCVEAARRVGDDWI